jgi:hypothetical protein
MRTQYILANVDGVNPIKIQNWTVQDQSMMSNESLVVKSSMPALDPYGSYLFQNETTVVNYTVSDRSNNTNNCSVTYYVKDITKPIFKSPPSPQVQILTADQLTTDKMYGPIIINTPQVQDYSKKLEYSYSIKNGTMVPVNTFYKVAIKVEDDSENYAYCSYYHFVMTTDGQCSKQLLNTQLAHLRRKSMAKSSREHRKPPKSNVAMRMK